MKPLLHNYQKLANIHRLMLNVYGDGRPLIKHDVRQDGIYWNCKGCAERGCIDYAVLLQHGDRAFVIALDDVLEPHEHKVAA